MAHKWKLSPALEAQRNALVAALRDEVADQRAEYDGRSDAWLEGDKGQAVDTWLENLEDVADALEDIPMEPED